MIDDIRRILAAESRIAFGLLFGSVARQRAHAHSDLDLAVGLAPGATLDHRATGALISQLEAATNTEVDLVVVDDAPAGLAYRIFRDGRLVYERDHAVFAAAKAAAIMRYLDFEPVEALCTRGVLEAAADGR